ncbi:CAP domain-containing protein [Telluria mixta]|uniref:CAP domain-containing protein n=2 Tax=Telluria mixta TaxID=34071 RepID=A0ABT2C8G9_9BURK|nr:CAP domain-containing protein [Telluria mixta]WEM99328.1 CAP domain-containing protein [Telluria mixta]
MNNMLRVRQIALACTAAWALVACGGGGGGSSAGAPNVTPSTGFSGQDASAPTATNNIATDGLNWINYRRSQIGMPALARNGVIDTAAQGHSDYQRINNVVTHDQTAGKTGYTGARLQDRLTNAGYVFGQPNAIGEVISATSNGSGFYMAEELITAIYHRFVIFEPVFKEIGAGAATTSANYSYFTADFVANNGYGTGIPVGTIVTWPFNGQTQVTPNFNSDYEEPDPVPDRDVVGYPVSVHTNLTRKLTVQSFTIRARGSNTDLATRMLVQGQDTNTSTQSAAAIVPLAQLASATTYDVSFSGAVDGVPISRSWSFTTK